MLCFVDGNAVSTNLSKKHVIENIWFSEDISDEWWLLY